MIIKALKNSPLLSDICIILAGIPAWGKVVLIVQMLFGRHKGSPFLLKGLQALLQVREDRGMMGRFLVVKIEVFDTDGHCLCHSAARFLGDGEVGSY